MEINNDSIKNVLQSLGDSVKKENKDLYRKLIVLPENYKITNPEDFYLYIKYDYERFVSGLIQQELNVSDNNIEFLLMNYSFIESQFQKLIQRKEGLSCCADKSRTIMKALYYYFKDKEPIKWDFTQEYTFHLPKKLFQEEEEILNFFRAIQNLYYGNFESYLNELKINLEL